MPREIVKIQEDETHTQIGGGFEWLAFVLIGVLVFLYYLLK